MLWPVKPPASRGRAPARPRLPGLFWLEPQPKPPMPVPCVLPGTLRFVVAALVPDGNQPLPKAGLVVEGFIVVLNSFTSTPLPRVLDEFTASIGFRSSSKDSSGLSALRKNQQRRCLRSKRSTTVSGGNGQAQTQLLHRNVSKVPSYRLQLAVKSAMSTCEALEAGVLQPVLVRASVSV
jgi:hypothetical protein